MRYYKFNNICICTEERLSYEEINSPQDYTWERIVIASNLNAQSKNKIAYFNCGLESTLCESYSDLRLDNSIDSSLIEPWLLDKIKNRAVSFVNLNAPNFEELITSTMPKKWRINILALGDVGATLTLGLRLLGGNSIDSIGIYDFDINKVNRVMLECNQIYSSFDNRIYPEIIPIQYDELFNCDMFVFCASKAIPSIDIVDKDVRMVQLEENEKIITQYAKLARNLNFKGIFSVVSDPVDLLCKVAYTESNTDDNGIFDSKGLSPENIRGYGLGVMNARAHYYANMLYSNSNYDLYGRAFGPHGKGLIIADNIENYNHSVSLELTEKTQNANLEIRKTGFKPYIAPALSSGALSIIATIENQWHYSAIYFGGVFMGIKNRLLPIGIEWEQYNFNADLYDRITSTYNYLKEIR